MIDNFKKYGELLKNLNPKRLKLLIDKMNDRTNKTNKAIESLRIKKK
jgi:hypothetical protein